MIRVDRDQLRQLLRRDPAPGLHGDVTRADGREQRLGLQRRDVLLRLSRKQFSEERLEPVEVWTPAPGQRFAAVGEHPQRLKLAVDLQDPQPAVPSATTATECASSASVFRLCPVSNSRLSAHLRLPNLLVMHVIREDISIRRRGCVPAILGGSKCLFCCRV